MTALALALVACCWALVLTVDVPDSRRREAVWLLALATPCVTLAGIVLQ